AAGGAAAVGRSLSDSEDHLAVLVVGADVVIATDAEGMVQQAGGHAELLVWRDFDTTPSGISMSTFFNDGARYFRMNLQSVAGPAGTPERAQPLLGLHGLDGRGTVYQRLPGWLRSRGAPRRRLARVARRTG